MKYTRQKGTKDVYGEDILKWQRVEEKIRKVCKNFNVKEVRTPVFEATELFTRSVGDDSDIVNKEMYTFKDRGDRSITLRPENTAGVVRAYIENGMGSMPSPVKLWYLSNVYRYEKMQKGRYREFNQFGIEMFGSEDAYADVEAIRIAYSIFKELGIENEISLNINSIGCPECRKKYVEALKEYIGKYIDNMCDDCKRRYEKNPLRIIDCKEETCKEYLKEKPVIVDYLCEDCKEHFEKVKHILNNLGIDYKVDPDIVRGLDYYNRTVFEFISNSLGLTVCGGGRYDTLVEQCGGIHTPAVGFGLGMERLLLLLDELNKNNVEDTVDVYIAALTDEVRIPAYILADLLRSKGISCDIDISNRSLKAQMKYANKINARYSITIGEDELKSGMVTLKDMNDKGNSFTCDLDANVIAKAVKIF